jgi:hypothetical protein
VQAAQAQLRQVGVMQAEQIQIGRRLDAVINHASVLEGSIVRGLQDVSKRASAALAEKLSAVVRIAAVLASSCWRWHMTADLVTLKLASAPYCRPSVCHRATVQLPSVAAV